MSKKRTIELANVVVNFGDKGLVENLNERVFPLIKDGSLRGKGEVNSYKFLGVRVQEIGNDKVPALFGRLVKVMTIEAEQELDENRDALIQSAKQIPSAPSSFFVINLTNHRMAYLGETRRSPTLRDFEYCLRRLLMIDWREKYKEALDSILAQEGRQRTPKGKRDEYSQKALVACPMPDVRVTPLPALQELDRKMEAFALITSVNIKPMKTNNELPDENSEFLRKYEEQQKRIGASATSIDLNNGTKGLVKDETQKLVKAASDGNYKVKLKGKSRNGNELKGDLEEVSVKLKEEIPAQESETARAERLLTKMSEAFSAGYIRAVAITEEIVEKARSVIRSINGGI